MKTFEEIHGVGPVGGSRPLDQDDGRRPTFKAIEKSTGDLVTCDEITFDPELHERLPAGGAP